MVLRLAALLYLLQAAWVQLPGKLRGRVLTRLVGTSSTDKTRFPRERLVKMSEREFGAHEGSSPVARTSTFPPPGGTMQISNTPPPRMVVKTIALPSGDQSGSVTFEAPTVRIHDIAPPLAGILYSRARPLARDTKQIQRPSGDQQGDDSVSLVVVSRRRPEPSALAVQMSGLPALLRTIATRRPSGDTAGLMFEPE